MIVSMVLKAIRKTGIIKLKISGSRLVDLEFNIKCEEFD
jgi:hypothetical protein